MDQLFHAVAIDGPSGAGKSTLARRVARELHFLYVDTGAIYRSIGWYVLQRGAALDNAELVAALLPGIGSTGYAGGLRRGAERYAAAGRERPYPCRCAFAAGGGRCCVGHIGTGF